MTDPIDDLRRMVTAWKERAPGRHGNVTTALPTRDGEPRYTVMLMIGDKMSITRYGLTRAIVTEEGPQRIMAKLENGLMVAI